MSARAFVFANQAAKRPMMVLDCLKLTATEAQTPAQVALDSVKKGMVVCPGEGRQPDRSTSYEVASVDWTKGAGKPGIIRFAGGSKSSPKPPES